MRSSLSKYRIVFVTGKGGVGKSLVSAAIAMAEAKRGNRVLLAELGTRSFFEKFFQIPYRSNSATLMPGLDVARWEAGSLVREYLIHYLKLERAVDLFLNNKIMRALVRVAPGLDELALLGKITSGHRHRWHSLSYDVIVVDAHATGHFMALLQAPRGLYEMSSVGPMASNCKDILDIIRNPEICRYVIVTLPEELPVGEALELHGSIAEEVGISADLICNKVLTPNYQEEVRALVREDGGAAASYLRYLDAHYRRQEAALQRLATLSEQVQHIPYYFQIEALTLVQAIATRM
jgi:hypothetical protein